MNYMKDEGELRRIAEELIESEPDLKHLSADCRIFYQYGLGTKGSPGNRTFADCQKVQDKLKEFVDADYVITFYASADSLTEDGLRVLMKHELMHIDSNGKDHRIRKHDIEDFRAITDVYGPDWAATFSTQQRMEGL